MFTVLKTLEYHQYQHILWILIAIGLGGIVALLPPDNSYLVLFAALFAIATIITPLSTLIFLLVLAPLRTLIATEGINPLPLDIGQALFLVYIASWVLNRLIYKKTLFPFSFSKSYIPLLCFIIATGLTVFTATSISAWLTEWLKWVIIFFVALLVSSSYKSQKAREWLMFAVILAGVANACIGLYIFLGGSGAPSLLIQGRFFRAFGTFGQPNPFGGFMGLLIPPALMLLLAYLHRLYHTYRANQRITLSQIIPAGVYALVSIVMVAAIFASWSRGAWLGLIIALAAMLFALPHKLWQSVTLAGTLCLIIMMMWTAGLLPQSVTARIASSTEEFFIFDDVRGVTITPENYAVVERLAHWQAALNMTREHPWLGIGLGNYEIVYEQYRLLAWQPALGHAHNYYLNIFAEAGILGLLSYIFLWAGMFYITWQARQHPDFMMRYLCIGLMGTWTYLMVHSLLDNLYVNNIFLHLGVLMGLAMLAYQEISTTKQ